MTRKILAVMIFSLLCLLPFALWAGVLYILQSTARAAPDEFDTGWMIAFALVVIVTAILCLWPDRRQCRPEELYRFTTVGHEYNERVMEVAAMAEARQYGRQPGGRVVLEVPPGAQRWLDYDGYCNLQYLTRDEAMHQRVDVHIKRIYHQP